VVNLQQVGDRLPLVFPSRVNYHIEAEDLKAHSVKYIARLACSVVMNKVRLDGDQGLHNDVVNLLVE
jgi:hypothetical protein